MKLGFENKKQLYALCGLGAIAAVMVYTQLLSGPSATPVPTVARPDAVAIPGSEEKSPEQSSSPNISRASEATSRPQTGKNGEFHPVLRSKKKEERAVLADRDPSLRLDLLEKVMGVPPAGGTRDLFNFSKEPPKTEVAAVKEPELKLHPFVGPRPPPPPPPPPTPTPEPPDPPITLKYYGIVTDRALGAKTAFFMDGDDIVLAVEGQTLKGRYKVVQIGADKVLFEDTVKNRRRSVNIEPEVTG